MSVANSIDKGGFDLNLITFRKPIEFPDGSVQITAYTGAGGSSNLNSVLTAGNNAGGLGMVDVGNITQNAFFPAYTGNNQLDTTIISTNTGATNEPSFQVADAGSGNELAVFPCVIDDENNFIVQANDVAIVAAGAGAPNLTLCCNSAVSSGVRINPSSVLVGAGGTIDTPTNCVIYQASGTEEYGQSHQFVNGVAQYDNVGLATKIIPSCSSTSATVAPHFEFKNVRLTGSGNPVSGVITLTNNFTNTTNYAVFPMIYYGFTGSGGTYTALQTSGAITPMVISVQTATDFTWNFNKSTGQNVNIELCFLITYDLAGTDFAKIYS